VFELFDAVDLGLELSLVLVNLVDDVFEVSGGDVDKRLAEDV
jgi:hypothetical protein